MYKTALVLNSQYFVVLKTILIVVQWTEHGERGARGHHVIKHVVKDIDNVNEFVMHHNRRVVVFHALGTPRNTIVVNCNHAQVRDHIVFSTSKMLLQLSHSVFNQ